MIEDLSTAIARERRRDLSREAAALRLVRLATCCNPSSVRERAATLLHWLRDGQLGKGYVYSSSAPVTARCCA
jgi:hypothetical protein